MPNMDVEKELREVKRRLDLAETKLAQQAGQFEFISGQLRDVQLYIHARFADMDARFEHMDARFDRMDARFDRVDTELAAVKAEMRERFAALEQNIDALPRAIAELLAQRS